MSNDLFGTSRHRTTTSVPSPVMAGLVLLGFMFVVGLYAGVLLFGTREGLPKTTVVCPRRGPRMWRCGRRVPARGGGTVSVADIRWQPRDTSLLSGSASSTGHRSRCWGRRRGFDPARPTRW